MNSSSGRAGRSVPFFVRAVIGGVALTLATLPALERVCDLACAAPVTTAAKGAPRCHPAPVAEEPGGRQDDHPCDHSHDVDALLTIGVGSKAGTRPSLAPAVLTAQAPAAVSAVVARVDRIRPSESPPLLRASPPVLRL